MERFCFATIEVVVVIVEERGEGGEDGMRARHSFTASS